MDLDRGPLGRCSYEFRHLSCAHNTPHRDHGDNGIAGSLRYSVFPYYCAVHLDPGCGARPNCRALLNIIAICYDDGDDINRYVDYTGIRNQNNGTSAACVIISLFRNIAFNFERTNPENSLCSVSSFWILNLRYYYNFVFFSSVYFKRSYARDDEITRSNVCVCVYCAVSPTWIRDVVLTLSLMKMSANEHQSVDVRLYSNRRSNLVNYSYYISWDSFFGLLFLLSTYHRFILVNFCLILFTDTTSAYIV